MGKWEKTHHFWAFSRFGTGTNSVVPVPYWFWSTGTGTEKSVPVPNVMFWTSVSVLAITW